MFIDVIWQIVSKYWEFIKYGLVGSVGFIIHISVVWYLKEIVDLWVMYSIAIAIVIAALNNYILNYRWTFSDKKKNIGNKVIGYFKYLLSRAFTEGLYFILAYIAIEKLGYHYMASIIILQVATAILGYLIALKWIWRDRKEKCSS